MKKPVYQSKDGKSYSTVAEAEKRDELIDAEIEFEHALEQIRRVFKETSKTADGALIVFGGWTTYWMVREVFGEQPSVQEIRLWSFDVSARTDEHHPGIVFYCKSHDGKWDRVIRADELYADERNAKRALLEVCEKRLVEFTADVEKLRNEVCGDLK